MTASRCQKGCDQHKRQCEQKQQVKNGRKSTSTWLFRASKDSKTDADDAVKQEVCTTDYECVAHQTPRLEMSSA